MTTDSCSHDTYVPGEPTGIAIYALGAFTGQIVSDRGTFTRSAAHPTARLRCQTDARDGALCYVQRACGDRARQRLAQRLARQLAGAWCIPWSDAALAPWLTHEHCRDNGEALVKWVLQNLEASVSESSAVTEDEGLLLETLSGLLGRVLAGIEETQP